MATMEPGEWYKTEGWPAPSWDQGGKWDPVNSCWKITRNGLYMFTVVAGGTVVDIAQNDMCKLYIALTTGDPDAGGVILASQTDVCSIDFPYYELACHAWRPLEAPLDVFCYIGQLSARGRDITFEPEADDYFSYMRLGSYPR